MLIRHSRRLMRHRSTGVNRWIASSAPAEQAKKASIGGETACSPEPLLPPLPPVETTSTPVLPPLPPLSLPPNLSKAEKAIETAKASPTITPERTPPDEPPRLEAPGNNNKKSTLKQLKNAARNVPYWLGDHPEAFSSTLRHLKLQPKNQSGGSELVLEYRQIYLDSVSSFYQTQLMAENNYSNDDDVVTKALKKLVDAGFHDQKWSKQFRSSAKQQEALIKMQAKIENQKKQLEYHQITLAKQQREEQAKRKELEEREEATEGAETKPETKPTTSFLAAMAEQVATFWGSAPPNPEPATTTIPTTRAIPNDKVQQRLKLKSLQKTIKKSQEAVGAVELKLAFLSKQHAELEPPLSEKQCADAQAVVDDVILNDLCPALAEHISERHAQTIEQYQTLDSKTDLTKPHEWFMRARLDRRKIIYHGGPTNSGKTYNALQKLMKAENGLYVGPLRLLAAEVYETLTSLGIYTNLMTGQEKRDIPFATHTAATVEIASTQKDYDVVVIDEIQMLADPFRGHSWTRALLGLRCKEIHVCGGLEAKDLVKKIAKDCGDEFELHEYERFSELTVADKSLASSSMELGSYKNVQPGDCVVAFARTDIFSIKREIETMTDYKCCVIYGSLPPETRAEQARRFNNQDSGYDILVASDAVGLGLNLNIQRIIFNTLYKSNGESIVRLDHSAVKQIAGRAGRRNSPFPDGKVTCRDPRDLAYIQQCLSNNVPRIEKAGLLPTGMHIELFADALNKYDDTANDNSANLNKLLAKFAEMATLRGDYFLCRQTPMQAIGRMLNDLDMPLKDKYSITMAPVATQNDRSMALLRKFALNQAHGKVSGIHRSMIPRRSRTFDELANLCSIHNDLDLFLWLSNKFPGNVVEQQAAAVMKEQCISFINGGLSKSDKLTLDHCYVQRDGRLRSSYEKGQNSATDVFADKKKLAARSSKKNKPSKKRPAKGNVAKQKSKR